MNVTPALDALQKLWRGPLYMVGGAVRDAVLGYSVSDTDLASPLVAEEVVRLLQDTPFTAKPNSVKLGTLGIYGMGEKFEYTAFRSDSYAEGGAHRPTAVEFGVDISDDAKRRDFTCNSVYFDIGNRKFVDPVGGLTDIQKRIIRTARAPEEVIDEDALRILRMVRFAAKLGFDLDERLKRAAINMRTGLKNIVPDRIRDELVGILLADAENGVKNAHVRGMELLAECRLTELVLPEVYVCTGVKQNPKWHAYDVYTHLIKTFENTPPQLELRLAALLHDIGKPPAGSAKGRTAEHPDFGAWLAGNRLQALHFSGKLTDRVTELIRLHMFDLRGDATDNEERLFVLENYQLIPELVALKNADRLGSGMRTGPSPAGERLLKTLETMKDEGVAFSIKELKINGNDVMKLPPAIRGYALKSLLRQNAVDPKVRTREGALEYISAFPG